MVSEKLHSDSQVHHQVHLVQTALLDASTSCIELKLAANVRSNVAFNACHVFIVQRSVVLDLAIAFGDLVFELYLVSNRQLGDGKKNLRLRVEC